MDIFDGILRSLIAATLLLLAVYVWFFERWRSEYEDRLEEEDEMQEPAKPAVSPSKKAHIMRRSDKSNKPEHSIAQASAPSKSSQREKSRRRYSDRIKSVFRRDKSNNRAPSLNIDQNNNAGQFEPPSSHRRHRHSAIRSLGPNTDFSNKLTPS